MPLMLASVRNAEEAMLVTELGADVIDAKEPALGALGAVSPATLAAIVQAVRGRAPVSATIGDLPPDPAVVVPAIAVTAAVGVDLVKVGLFPEGDRRRLIAAIAPMTAHVRLVGMLLADRDPDLGLIPDLAAAGFVGVMIDTADKAGRGLLRIASEQYLEDLVRVGRAHGLFVGLAGALRLADLPVVLRYGADVLGFRTALTTGERAGALSAAAVARIRGSFARSGRDVVLRPAGRPRTPPRQQSGAIAEGPRKRLVVKS